MAGNANGRTKRSKSGYDTVALVLQGGGALGSYQAGVYQGMHEAGVQPDWVAGISIGAINAAIIAGSPLEERVERLHGFWESICRPYGYGALPWGDMVAAMWRDLPGALAAGPFGAAAVGAGPFGSGSPSASPFASYAYGSPGANSVLAATNALLYGQPGFFQPRPFPPFWPQGQGPAGASYYDTTPLEKTLNTYVDFDLLNRGDVRASFGAVNVRTGNFAYFDSTKIRLTARHVMASGALPPGFPAVEIDGEYYWDGGVVSNTPLYYVLSPHPTWDTLALQVDLWPARGPLPDTMEKVMERQKDIQYSSRTRLVTDLLQRNLALRQDLQHLLALLPEKQRNAPDLARIRESADTPVINVINLIYQSKNYERHSKDYEFGTEAMREHWQSGLADIRATLARPDVLARPQGGSGFVSHDIHRG